MKIRTDFVTNSSSYSGATIIIENPVLLEILQRYKDMGTFEGEESQFSIGEYDFDPEEFDFTKGFTKTPAFTSGDRDWMGTPEKLSEVVKIIIETIDENILDNYDFISDLEKYEEMKSELEERKDEIMAGYKRVLWNWGIYTNEHDNPYKGWTDREENFSFDPEKGEEFHSVLTAKGGEDEVYKEGDIIEERHVINGKEIK